MNFNKFEKYLVLLFLIFCIYFFMGVFIPPILMGIVIATTLNSFYQKRIFNLGSTARASVITILFGLILIIPIALLLTMGAIQGREVFSQINIEQLNNVSLKIYNFLADQKLISIFFSSEEFTFNKYNQILLQTGINLKEKGLSILQNVVTTIPWILFSFAILTATIFFSLIEAPKFRKVFLKNSFYPEAFGKYMLEEISKVSKAVIFATLGSAIAQATLIMIPSLIFNLSNFVFIVFATFFMSMIPLIGTAPVIIALLVSHYLDQNYLAVFFYIGFGILIGTVDNVIRAKIIERTSKIHPFLAFLSALGGIKAMGFFGIFLGPVILISTVKAFRYVSSRSKNES